jgi:predicted site-specific integrase-resolvase
MLKVRGVKVHDDTHTALKLIKVQKRSKSIDEVIRDLIKMATGKSVEKYGMQIKERELTSYLQRDKI